MSDCIRQIITQEPDPYPMGGTDPNPEPRESGHWECEHKETCPDQSQFLIVETRYSAQDKTGTVLRSQWSDMATLASCLCCDAPAKWVEGEDDV